MDKENLEKIAARADRALATVVALDPIIMDSLEDISRLVVEVDNLQGRCHKLLSVMRRINVEADRVLYELDPFTVPPAEAQDGQSTEQIVEVVDKEIQWCNENPDRAFTAEYRKGFINGLIQAKYLIGEMANKEG